VGHARGDGFVQGRVFGPRADARCCVSDDLDQGGAGGGALALGTAIAWLARGKGLSTPARLSPARGPTIVRLGPLAGTSSARHGDARPRLVVAGGGRLEPAGVEFGRVIADR
jgi:hypothetical protein